VPPIGFQIAIAPIDNSSLGAQHRQNTQCPYKVTNRRQSVQSSTLKHTYTTPTDFGGERACHSHPADIDELLLKIEHRLGSSIGLRPPKTIVSP
jgi:hypothetical protein